jgi:hypothetical protein
LIFAPFPSSAISTPHILVWESAVPDQRLREAWHAHERGVPISAELNFTRDGLVLGAGTVIVSAEGPRLLKSLDGEEARVLALLSAAYGKAVPPSVLGNIRRAAKAWGERDDCLAYIHLTHAGLQPLHDYEESAYRLFLVDSAISVGGRPRAVCEALHLNPLYIDTVEKFYDENEPRVPAGSGRTSGQWTRLLSWIAELDAAQLVELGIYVARFLGPAGGAAAVFGLLFIPSPNNVHVEGQVSGLPGLRYSWNRDEALLHFTYDSGDGEQHTFAAYVEGDRLYDEQGKVIGRVLPDGGILIESAVASPDLAKDDEPRLCPIPGPDKPNKLGLAYANYAKLFVNPPPNTTPSGIGFQLPNPKQDDDLVYYDDCRLTTGMMTEFKGPGYGDLLTTKKSTIVPEWTSVIQEWWEESGRQIAASDGRPVRWYFADLAMARFARQLFDSDKDGGRQRIEVVFLPWSRRGQ